MKLSMKINALVRKIATAGFLGLGLAAAPVSLLGTTAPAAYAQGVPTVDTQNIAQEIRQLHQD